MKYIKTFEKRTMSLDEQLIDAIHFDNKVDKVKYLIENGADINFKNTENDNLSPLMISIIYGRIEIIKYLIEKGADINCKNITDKTPLMIAGVCNSLEIIQILIEAGADWNIKDEDDYDFLEQLDDSLEEIIREDYPEQYSYYLMRKKSEKYNL